MEANKITRSNRYKIYWKRLLTLSLVFCLSVPFLPLYTGEAAELPAEEIQTENEVLVTLGQDQDRLALTGSDIEAQPVTEDIYLLSLEDAADPEAALTEMIQNNEIKAIQPNYIYTAYGVNDPYYSKQWGLTNAGTQSLRLTVWDRSTTIIKSIKGIDIAFPETLDLLPAGGRETVVAIIDSEFDYTHEDLKGQIWKNKNETSNGKDTDKNGYIDDIYGWDFVKNKPLSAPASSANDHATHCAGIIGATTNNNMGIAGIASQSNLKLMSLKVLDTDDSGTTDGIIKAIKYAEKNGAVICNMSFGTYKYDSLLEQTMKNSDMLFIAAAGNEGIDTDYTPNYPSAFTMPNIIAVANLQFDGNLLYSSNFGKKSVDLAAPGTYIYSTVAGNRYDYMSGTSMAAPFVTGVAALAYSYYDGITPLQVGELLLDNTRVMPELKGMVATGGMVSMYSVMSAYDQSAFAPDTTAPEISAKVTGVKDSYKQKITVTVTDNHDAINEIRYVKGSKDISYFKNTEKGKSVSLNENGKGSFQVSVSGKYTIYAEDFDGNGTVKVVTAKIDAPTAIDLDYSSYTLKKGKSFTLKVYFTGGKSGRALSFTSSKPAVASVSKTGKVTGKKKGTAVITVKTSNGLKATCTVKVK
ncbi:S8 family peptidase [Anaerolentibacter hominis]|uniref:S8 family peptidase n=1 Tax=Anaerolentibacter hominis TaxID=3079009 RepID=UPI0031B80976